MEMKEALIKDQHSLAIGYANIELIREFGEAIDLNVNVIKGLGLGENEHVSYNMGHWNSSLYVSLSIDVDIDVLLSPMAFSGFTLNYSSLNYDCTDLTMQFVKKYATNVTLALDFRAEMTEEYLGVLRGIGKIQSETITKVDTRTFSTC